MITHDARRSLTRGNNPVPSPWLATIIAALSKPRPDPGRLQIIPLCMVTTWVSSHRSRAENCEDLYTR
jgi:hypothetical protein